MLQRSCSNGPPDIIAERGVKHYQCPHCGENGIWLLRKLVLGPAIPAKCTKCGKLVTVKYWHVLAVSVPALLPIYLFEENGFSSTFIVALAVGLLTTAILVLKFVPLGKHEGA